MATLLMRLAGPMQSWGVASRFSDRDTLFEPSKSGVIGLLCAALGRPRDAPVDDLAALRMGVRVDREGVLRSDYQTIGGERPHGEPYGSRYGGKWSGGTILSRRHYLADADFLVGLEGADREQLEGLQAALEAPRWQLYLGRKGYVPGQPVPVPGEGVLDEPLEAALAGYPWPNPLMWARVRGRPEQLRLVLEQVGAVAGDVRQDQPTGASFATRRFAARVVSTRFAPLPVAAETPTEAGVATTEDGGEEGLDDERDDV